jgi:four helix bundle protein
MARLENLQAWILGKDVAVRAYRLTRERPLRYHPRFADQIQRAALSIPANIAEGYALGTKAQLVRGVRIAFGSNQELRTHLEVAVAIPAVPDDDRVQDLLRDILRLNGLLVGLLKRYGGRPPET